MHPLTVSKMILQHLELQPNSVNEAHSSTSWPYRMIGTSSDGRLPRFPGCLTQQFLSRSFGASVLRFSRSQCIKASIHESLAIWMISNQRLDFLSDKLNYNMH